MCVTELPALIPAVLWTRKEIREFKESLRKNSENIIRVSSLSIATVSNYYKILLQHTTTTYYYKILLASHAASRSVFAAAKPSFLV